MKFGPVAIAEALGAVLAHSIDVGGQRLKKGKLLESADIKALKAAGIRNITVARLDDNDVGENNAALRIAQLLEIEGVEMAAPFTGRVNLYSKISGIFQADSEVVDVLNQVSPAITLATLPDGVFVEAGRMLATVKIIPFAVNGDEVSAAERLLKQSNAMKLVPSRAQKVGLIATKLPTLKPSVIDKTAKILASRLVSTGSEIVFEDRVDHTDECVSNALQKASGQSDLIIVFGASAITDQADVIPQGIRMSGGRVTYFGMPVDPGNLLLIGELEGLPIIGAPGCARSPAENGFDWVLQRMLAGLPVDADYITGLGVGGLLMEITARPQPREG